MKYTNLGQSDLRISVMTLGTWLTAGETLALDALGDVLATADQIGINAIDTADSYGFGDAETALGILLKSYPKHHFVIMTKCYFSTNREDPDTPRGLSKQMLSESAEACLKRLQVDCIDLLQCHRPDPKVPVAETVEAMELLVKQGKIRWWGTSKWPNEKLDEAYGAGATHMISRQELYNLFHREPEKDHFVYNDAHNLGLLAYSPLARGALTGKYQKGIPADSRAAHTQNKSTVYDLTPEKLEKVAELETMAHGFGCSVAQLALAYLLHQPQVNSVLLGASRASQLVDNEPAINVQLSAENINKIRTLFSAYTG